MSHKYSAIKNKQQKHPTQKSPKYLYNSNEPDEDILSDSPPDLIAELRKMNVHDLRRNFRHINRKLRKYYA